MARVHTVEKYRGPRTEGKSLPRCGRAGCGKTIERGDRYFWWSNRAPGMRGGQKHFRCYDHFPTVAERTPGRRGQLYGIQESVETSAAALTAAISVDGDEVSCPVVSDFQGVAEEAAGELRGLAEELQEGATNIEEGFGHPTSQSEELAEKAEELEGVCTDLEDLDFEEAPEREDDLTDEAYTEILQQWAEDQAAKINEKMQEAEV
jgi:hypothetical protein